MAQAPFGLPSARKTVQWTVFSEPGAEPAAKGRAGADSPRPTGPQPPPVLRMRRLPAAGVVQERLDLGGESEAYQEIARRLHLMPEDEAERQVLDMATHRKRRGK